MLNYCRLDDVVVCLINYGRLDGVVVCLITVDLMKLMYVKLL
jgi:hypothetical protein